MHENLTREEEVQGSSDRTFGLVIGAAFALIGLVPLLHGETMRWWALALAAAFILCGLFWTAPLGPLNVAWMKFGLLLAKIVSPIVLTLLFYVTVTPVGLLMRAFGKDPMRTRRDAAAASYWIVRDPPGPAPDTMKNQF